MSTARPYAKPAEDTFGSTSRLSHAQRAPPPWYVTWTLRRHRYLQPFYRTVPWLSSRRSGRLVTVGQLVFWTVYLGISAAVLAVLLAQYVSSYDGSVAASSTSSATTSSSGLTSTGHGPGGKGGGGDAGHNGAASTLGTFGTLLALFALVPVGRNSILVFLLNLPFERAIAYHRYIAYGAILLIAAHGATYIGLYASKTAYPNGIGSQLWDGGPTGVNFSGLIAWIAMALLAITSLPWIRRHAFEVFYRLHVPLFVVFVAFAAIHEGQAIGILVLGLILYAADVALRVRSTFGTEAKIVAMKVLPGGVVRIEFDKEGFRYKSGQYVFVCIPALSVFEWHPFSLSSSPRREDDDEDNEDGDELMSIHIRVLGNWTAKLARLASATADASTGDPGTSPLPKMLIEGPYGTPTFPMDQYKNLILISGGIGITPLQSIYNGEIISDWKRGRRELRHVIFAWTVREGGAYDYLLDEATQKAHKLESNLGVLPPFHSPMLLKQYEDERHRAEMGRGDSELFRRQPTNEHPIITTEFYLTRGHAAAPTAASQPAAVAPLAQHGGEMLEMADTGANTTSPVWVRSGRPDIDGMFTRMLAQPGGEHRCAVLVCGPESLVNAVKAACVRYTGPAFSFDLHEETFEL
ncbi:hypothetical protein HDU87_006468 [Geranomyces variabilis]|uniref:FAD-binding FR-type domain-containing protein n=1 Tax=Geranomyces variabilis TaxID=109894 RepID=A0AAD5TFC6_9FUNG|nr:hypothetical protein HDU87_006468 [Geranomyces variabilis]